MAGIALALDLLRKSPTSYNTIHSSSTFTAATAASVAAVTTPYAYKSLFGIPIVECDVGATTTTILATDEDEFLEKTQGVNPFKMSLKRICREYCYH
ncbi:hypothetical protein F8388_022847 [Cannabis sativa]|uniref:Uncharacterized protein n=1 Tax=Cannabis sativa TaxID=3483 RepID=A0A7J6FC16_CANSA|nr:hypothetical protein F8388_022847 [Cannabis sativa]